MFYDIGATKIPKYLFFTNQRVGSRSIRNWGIIRGMGSIGLPSIIGIDSFVEFRWFRFFSLLFNGETCFLRLSLWSLISNAIGSVYLLRIDILLRAEYSVLKLFNDSKVNLEYFVSPSFALQIKSSIFYAQYLFERPTFKNVLSENETYFIFIHRLFRLSPVSIISYGRGCEWKCKLVAYRIIVFKNNQNGKKY